MIEVAMVRRMMVKGVLVAPAIVAALGIAGGTEWALSGAIGLAMALGNLWLSARIIGGVAEHSPQLLLPAGFAAFLLGLLALTGIAFALRSSDVVSFPVTGFVLIGAHLGLVLWEAATTKPPTPTAESSKTRDPVDARS